MRARATGAGNGGRSRAARRTRERGHLWAVRLRYLSGGSKVARRIGWGALLLLLGLGVVLAF